jgi:pimeloyl-ACP methyl ester carboxylesterase
VEVGYMNSDGVELQCGVVLPCDAVNANAETILVLAHGLGAKDPKEKDHSDKWLQMARRNFDSHPQVGYIAYTARGHGCSRGWEDTAESDYLQFTWHRLADDMIGIADNYSIPSFIACGSSMGSATSLFAAMYHPERVKAVIMIRPPTAWDVRRARKSHLLKSANRLHKEFPAGVHHLVLMGAAESDLPPLDSELYDNVSCPVLILTYEGDDAHPVSTATALAERIKHAEIYIEDNVKTAQDTWADVISSFVERIRL